LIFHFFTLVKGYTYYNPVSMVWFMLQVALCAATMVIECILLAPMQDSRRIIGDRVEWNSCRLVFIPPEEMIYS
jgi:hypothetical protein